MRQLRQAIEDSEAWNVGRAIASFGRHGTIVTEQDAGQCDSPLGIAFLGATT